MRKIGLLVALLSVCLISTANAHLATVAADMGLTDNPITVYHDDSVDNPEGINKGSFVLTITNTGVESWGDFHFEVIFGTMVFGTPEGYPSLTINGAPVTVSSTLSGDLKKLDVYYYGTPINQNDTATFTVYTDNTANGGMFGIAFWPTPVPEPMTMVLLGLGSLVAFRRK